MLDNINNMSDVEREFRKADALKKLKETPAIKAILSDIPDYDSLQKDNIEHLLRIIALSDVLNDALYDYIKSLKTLIKRYEECNKVKDIYIKILERD